MARATGSVITVDRACGPVLFLKGRDVAGRQVKRRLGPLHVGRGTPAPGTFTRKQAEDALRVFLVELGSAPAAGGTISLEQATEAWLRYIENDRGRAPSYVRDCRNAVRRYLLGELGAGTPIARITTRDIDELRGRLLAQGLAPRTVRKPLVMLHGILRLAKRRDWIATNPAENAERVSVPRRGEFAVLTPAEVHAVAAHAQGQLGPLITVAAFTGLRMGELRALRWRDVDFANRIVHVRRSYTRLSEKGTKSGLVRSVPLIDQAATALDALSRREHFTGPDDRVFVTATGRQLHDDTIRDGFYDALEAAGVDRDRGTGKPLVFHDLRHSFGTLAVQAFALTDVKAYMGHADIQTTMIYVHHVPQHDAADKLTALVSKASGTSEIDSTVAPSSPIMASVAP